MAQTDEERIKQLTDQLTKKLNLVQEDKKEAEAEEEAKLIIKEHKARDKRVETTPESKIKETIVPKIVDKEEDASEKKIRNLMILIMIGVTAVVLYYMIAGKSKEEKYSVGVERLYEGIQTPSDRTGPKEIKIFNNEIKNIEKEMEVLEKTEPVISEGIKGEVRDREGPEKAKERNQESKEKAENKVEEKEKSKAVKEAEKILDLDEENKLRNGL